MREFRNIFQVHSMGEFGFKKKNSNSILCVEFYKKNIF